MTKKEMQAAIKDLKNRLGVNGARSGYYGIEASKEEGGLYISTLSGKLAGMHSASTSPELCGKCQNMAHCKGSICEKCFSRRSIIPELGGYKNGLRAALAHNTEWLSIDRKIEDFPVLNDLYFRIESHGEVGKEVEARNFFRLCLRNPETHVTAWTKFPWIWDAAFKTMGGKPENLIMIYSSPMINREVSWERINKLYPWIEKVFTVFSPEYIIQHPEIESTINCGARQCLACKLCYTHNDVRQIREILK